VVEQSSSRSLRPVFILFRLRGLHLLVGLLFLALFLVLLTASISHGIILSYWQSWFEQVRIANPMVTRS
jgi:hypothetical protein